MDPISLTPEEIAWFRAFQKEWAECNAAAERACKQLRHIQETARAMPYARTPEEVQSVRQERADGAC